LITGLAKCYPEYSSPEDEGKEITRKVIPVLVEEKVYSPLTAFSGSLISYFSPSSFLMFLSLYPTNVNVDSFSEC